MSCAGLIIYIHNLCYHCRDAFDLNYGVGILRLPEGLDRNKVPDELLDYNEESDDEEFEISDEGFIKVCFYINVRNVTCTVNHAKKQKLP